MAADKAVVKNAATATATAPIPSDHDAVRGRLMALSLAALLDKAAGAREVLPHLAALERGLMGRGAEAIAQVPAQWLARIVSQLASLPLPEQDPPLHDLLQRLMARLHAQDPNRDAAVGGVVADANEPESDHERTLVIREISHSEFVAAQNELLPTVFEPRL